MTPREIILLYPDVYGKPPFDPMKTLMCFGFECNSGWYPLLEKLSEDIQNHLNKNPELKEGFIVTQVKEKFGTLSFYYCGGDKYIDNLVNEAEKLSSITCEKCGEVGKLENNNGWYVTICEKCKNKEKK